MVWLRALAASVSLLVLIASGIAWVMYKNFTSSIPHGSPVPALGTGQKDVDGASQNILLVGSDSRAGATPDELKLLSTQQDGGSINTDTMMVLHIPSDGHPPTVISFPRDSWVSIPGYGKNKLNAAYPDAYNDAKNHGETEVQAQSAGLIETIKTIDALTGLHVDHYMQVDLLGFYRISVAVGGIQVCLLHAQNAETDSDAYGKGYSGIDLPAGVSTVEGKQALAFVRQRHGLPNGDLDRIRRQQYFLEAAFRKIASAGVLLNPFKLNRLLSAVGSSLLTDPSLDLMSLAQQFESLASGSIAFETIPNNGPQLIYPDGVETSIVEVNTAAIPAFVAQLEGRTDSAYAAARAASPGSVTLDVLNATDVARLAAHNADALKARGFHVNVVDSAPTTMQTTTIEYPTGHEAEAKAVAAVVPGAKVIASPDVSRVTLLLGGDGHWLAGNTASAPRASGTPAGSATSSGAANGTAPKPTPANGLGCIN